MDLAILDISYKRLIQYVAFWVSLFHLAFFLLLLKIIGADPGIPAGMGD